MASLQNIDKYFLQYMLKNGCVTLERATQYHEFLKEALDVNDASLQGSITEINSLIENQDFEIDFVTCEVTSTKLVVFKNLKSDNMSQKQAPHSPVELEYFQAILSEIIEAQDHRISHINCLHLTNSLHGKLQQGNVETVLKKWIKDYYLVERDNHIYLGARTIEEFKPYFKKHYQDFIHNCNLCSNTVFWGQRCNSCGEIMHFHCLNKFSQRVCPNCKNDFEEDVNMEASLQSSSGTKKKRKT